MAKSRRSYKGAPVSNTLASGGLAQGATTISLATAMSGWPTGSAPFFVVVNPGTANEEKICVIYATTTTLTVVDEEVTSGWSASANGRGVDDTTDRVHAGGATIYPVFTALEANQANLLVSTYANQGGIVYQGASNPTQLAIGTAGQVLKVNSGVTAPEWGQVATAGIADDAVTTAKIDTGAVTATEIASNAVTTAKILDANVTTAKIADDSITSPKIAAPTLTAKTDTFTLALVDENCTMQCNKATGMTVTVPTSSVAFATGAVVTLMQYNDGQVTIAGASGVDIRSSNGLKLRAKYSMATLVKISDTEWVLSGDTVA